MASPKYFPSQEEKLVQRYFDDLSASYYRTRVEFNKLSAESKVKYVKTLLDYKNPEKNHTIAKLWWFHIRNYIIYGKGIRLIIHKYLHSRVRGISHGNLIELNSELLKSASDYLHVLLHELAHEYLHTGPALISGEDCGLTSKEKEIHAEAVAFILCRYFRVDTLQPSVNYLLSHKVRYKELKREKDLILSTSLCIVRDIKKWMEDTKNE